MMSIIRVNVLSRTITLGKFVRSITSNCWKCGTSMGSNIVFCPSSSCEAIQPVELDTKKLNLFQLFGLTPKIDIDIKDLEMRFKNMQSRLHPDKFATKSIPERNASGVTSSSINQAYQILKCPTSRVEYTLKLKCGIDLGDETLRSHQDTELNMEIFEIRESIEDSENTEELREIRAKVSSLVHKYMDQFNASLAEKKNPSGCDGAECCEDCTTAHSCATRLKYYSKILEELETITSKMEPSTS